MTFQSMTGYGSAQIESGGWQLSIECRSVNHRSLEPRFFVGDAQWRWLEPVAMESVKQSVRRGRVDVRVDAVAKSDGHVAEAGMIDAGLFREVCRELAELTQENGLSGGVELRDVLVFRSRFERHKNEKIEKSGDYDEAAVLALQAAVEQFVESRILEGSGIRADLCAHLDRIERGLSQILDCVVTDADAYNQRLVQRLQDAASRFELGELDEQRVAQELVFYADRSDISEELQRASSHVIKLRGLMRVEEIGEPRGKKIDFYLQELFRETNTMGSKSNSAVLTDEVIDIKSSIEKMREQAANVE